MPQFLIDPKRIRGAAAHIVGEEARHLIRVLRHKAGDHIRVGDGSNRWRAVIQTASAKEVVLRLLEKIPLKTTAPAPVLGVALLKQDHLEWVLQKGVELGCQEFWLLETARTIPHFNSSTASKKLERYKKIALESAKQSGLIAPPQIHLPLSFSGMIGKFLEFSGVILAWEEEPVASFHSVFASIPPAKILLLIGPEGGWTLEEVRQAERSGAKTAHLGQQILRSETAALTTLALCQYELGNL